MKQVVSILLAALFLLAAVPMAVSAEPFYTVEVVFNEGGTVGYNTTGSSVDFTAFEAGGGTFQVQEFSGMTIGALPDEGRTVVDILRGDTSIDPNMVYMSDEGRFVVDNGNVASNERIEFIFAPLDGVTVPFEPTGQPPVGPGPGDPGDPGDHPDFDTAIYFPLDGNRFGWDIDATFGSIGNGFVNEQGMLEIPATRGADVRICIHPQQVESEEFGPYYPHLGSIYYTDQMGEHFVPYYRMNDVTDPDKEAPRGIFVYETVIQNVQDPIEIGFTEDEWHGHIEQELDPDADPRLLDNVIDVDLTTGERVFIPELAGVLPIPAGIYKVGDLPYELSDALVALGFSLDDDFVEVSNTEWGEPMFFTLLLELEEPFETEFVGAYDLPHAENLLSKIIVNAFGNEPDETWPVPDSEDVHVLEQFDRNDGIAVFRFDYYFNQAMVQRRDVFHVRLQTPQPDEPIDDFLYGDVNQDGSVDMKDVLLLRRFIAHLADESEICRPAADVNLDESLDMKDVLMIRKYIAHLIDFLGVPINPVEPYELPPITL